MTIIKIVMLFIGLIIGAGFATGAEIVLFFGNYNLPIWIISLCVTLSLFALISVMIFIYKPNKNLGNKFTSFILIILYFVFFTAMTAGIVSIAGLQAGIISLIICAVIATFGFDKLAKINMFIVITIIIVLFFICISYIQNQQIGILNFKQTPNIVFSALIYSAFNCFAIPQFIDTSQKNNCKKGTLYLAGLISSAIIGALVYLILNAVKFTNTESATIPLLAISNTPITFLIILLAILTSQYSTLFALMQKFQNSNIYKKTHYKTQLICVCICAYICSFMGFSQIIALAYPTIGIIIFSYLFFSLIAHCVFLRKKQRQFDLRQQVHH